MDSKGKETIRSRFRTKKKKGEKNKAVTSSKSFALHVASALTLTEAKTKKKSEQMSRESYMHYSEGWSEADLSTPDMLFAWRKVIGEAPISIVVRTARTQLHGPSSPG